MQSSLRSVRFQAALRRSYASTPASQTASAYADKAQASAKTALAAAQRAAGPTGDKVVKHATSLTDSIVYNAKVFASLAKQVYVKENLAPPTSVAQITAAYANAWSKASNFSYWSKLWSSGQWKTFGVYALQAYGLFKIGEMVGRRSIVGYSVEEPDFSEEH